MVFFSHLTARRQSQRALQERQLDVSRRCMMLKIASQMEAMWRLFGEMDESVSFRRALLQDDGGLFDVSIGQRTPFAKTLPFAHHCIFETFNVRFRATLNPPESATLGAKQTTRLA